jgi:hypothetical protein
MIWEESALRFEFGNRWHVLKLDEHPDYRNRIEKLSGTKAVDFLGILDNDTIYFVEVKNFRGHRIENKERLQDGLLVDELGQKVRDSLACIISAHRVSSENELWKKFVDILCDKQKHIKVIIWLEQDLPNHPTQQRKTLNNISSTKFKSKLAWLTPYVMVGSLDNNKVLPDVKVDNLPRKTS